MSSSKNRKSTDLERLDEPPDDEPPPLAPPRHVDDEFDGDDDDDDEPFVLPTTGLIDSSLGIATLTWPDDDDLLLLLLFWVRWASTAWWLSRQSRTRLKLACFRYLISMSVRYLTGMLVRRRRVTICGTG